MELLAKLLATDAQALPGSGFLQGEAGCGRGRQLVDEPHHLLGDPQERFRVQCPSLRQPTRVFECRVSAEPVEG